MVVEIRTTTAARYEQLDEPDSTDPDGPEAWTRRDETVGLTGRIQLTDSKSQQMLTA